MATPTVAQTRVQKVQAPAPAKPPPPENKFRVCAHGENVHIQHLLAGQAIAPKDAKYLAAWLSVCADISDDDLLAARREITGDPEPEPDAAQGEEEPSS
jgi:hypothetical protein